MFSERLVCDVFAKMKDTTGDDASTSKDEHDTEIDIMAKMGLPTSFTARSRSNRQTWQNFLTDDMIASSPKKSQNIFSASYLSDAERAFDKFWTSNAQDIIDRTWRHKFPNEVHSKDSPRSGLQNELYRDHCFAVCDEEKHNFLRNYSRGRDQCETMTFSSSQTSSGSPFEYGELPEELPAIVGRDDEFDDFSQLERKTATSFSKLLHGQVEELEVPNKFVSPKSPPVLLQQKHHKYWHQRYRLFSKFDDGIKLDEESWYSVTPEEIAKHIAKRCVTLNNTKRIIDAFCGAGGNTIQFALADPGVHVIAIDIDPAKIELAKNNAAVYGVQDQIEFIVGDFVELIPELSGDVVFLSPPWGGPCYLHQKVFRVDTIEPSVRLCLDLIRNYVTHEIALLVPRNTYENDLRELAGGTGMLVEIEKNCCNKKVKMITAYFGDLISNQERTPSYFP